MVGSCNFLVEFKRPYGWLCVCLCVFVSVQCVCVCVCESEESKISEVNYDTD